MTRIKDWKTTKIPRTSTIRDAIECLNKTSKRVVLVADDDWRLIGILVDGDVRRGLLRGAKLTDPITSILNTNAITTSQETPSVVARQLMSQYHVSHLPIVDETGKLCGIHSDHDLGISESRKNLFVFMAGGFGRRMGDETAVIPKPMLRINGRPIIESLILTAKEAGFGRFLLATHYQSEVIEDYFADGSAFGVQIEYLREDKPLGTAGALSLIRHMTDLPIVVSNSDLVSSINFGAIADFHSEQRSDLTVAVHEYQFQNPYGVVHIKDDSISLIVEKPMTASTVCTGVYVIEPMVLEIMEEGEHCDFPKVISDAIDNGKRVVPFHLYEDWMDIGYQKDLKLAREKLSKEHAHES